VFPKVVIVGRPNVGKSSLFNWLVDQRIAIVDPRAGVTRDRVSFVYDIQGRAIELVDTGGMGIEDSQGLTDDVERQISIALAEADLILFVVDAHTGLLPLDELVAHRLRSLDKPILVVANKCDDRKARENANAEFHRLGHELIFVSAAHNINRSELWDAIVRRTPVVQDSHPNPVMKLAVVGKRNVGKSTFINQLAQSERMIVSETPGTTRDSVDVRFEHNGQVFVAIDTAGVQRKRSLQDSVDFYGFSRAQRTIRRADVVLFFVSSTEELSQVDVRLAQYILEQAKPCVLIVNKWDLLADQLATSQFAEYLDSALPTLDFAPRVFITARTGKHVTDAIDVAWSLFKQAHTRESTSAVNRALETIVARRQPPLRFQRQAKFFYATQAGVNPPTIVVFCNQPSLVDPQYERYMKNSFRALLSFEEIPIRLVFRKRSDRGAVEKRIEAELAEQTPTEQPMSEETTS
jgi:GTP-binding protein